jgi:N4-gp56 family major capsid protein
MRTLIGVNDPQAVKKWASLMAVAINKASYWARKFVGEGKDARLPFQRIDDLESGAGEEVTVDLLMPMNMEPVIGDETLDGKEQPLKYYTDRMRIDQVRGGSDLGSRMTKKRTLRNLRQDAKRVNTDWWKRLMDELYFIYLSGTRGHGGGYIWSANNPFFQVNPLTAPDSMHQLYGGAATSKATVTSGDSMKLRMIDKAVAKAETMGGDGSDELSMIPISIEGGDHYVTLMHTFQADALRQDAGTGGWLDIQKAAAAAEGAKNPIFTGAMGMYNDSILHKHRNVIRFNDFGAGGNLPAARALFLGAQAGFVAYGDNETGTRYRWTEVQKDHENSVAIGTHAIMGVKKATYKSKDGNVQRDFGVFAMDTYCADPNA